MFPYRFTFDISLKGKVNSLLLQDEMWWETYQLEAGLRYPIFRLPKAISININPGIEMSTYQTDWFVVRILSKTNSRLQKREKWRYYL